MLSLMSLSLAVLTKKAIEASLQQNWKQAINLNTEILKVYPNNVDTKIRLGRCYLQTRDFTKAKKIFREVLKSDPINSLALKNLELAKNQKIECNGNGSLKTKSLLKEPGTTCETNILTKKGVKGEDFMPGESLPISIKGKALEIYKYKKDKKIQVGTIEETYIVQKVKCALEREKHVSVTFIKAKEKEILVLIKASIPIFKPDKIEIRPYLKKGTIDEPELETEFEETE